MNFDGFKHFVKDMFSDNGVPSSSRVLTFWLSVSSMALLWYIVRHTVYSTPDKAAIWVNGLPYIIGALTAFVVSPYAINKGASSISDVIGAFRKNKDRDGQ